MPSRKAGKRENPSKSFIHISFLLAEAKVLWQDNAKQKFKAAASPSECD